MKITKQARREAKQLFRSCQVERRMDAGRVLLRTFSTKAHVGPDDWMPIVRCIDMLAMDLESGDAQLFCYIIMLPELMEGICLPGFSEAQSIGKTPHKARG